MGLMQIMPVTWTELRSRYRLGVDPYDPHDQTLAYVATLAPIIEGKQTDEKTVTVAR